MTSLNLENITKINNNTLEYNYKIKKYSRRFRKGSFDGIVLSWLKRDYNFYGNDYIINYRELIQNIINDIVFSEEFQILCIHEDNKNNVVYTADLQMTFYRENYLSVQIPSSQTEWLSIGNYADYILDGKNAEYYDPSYDTDLAYFEAINKKLISESEVLDLELEYSYAGIGEAINKKYAPILSNISWNRVKITLTNKFAPAE